MTTHTAHWDDAIAAPRPILSILGEVAITLKTMWSRRRTQIILSDLDDHMLRDIGVDPRMVHRGAAHTSGWMIKAQARMPAPVFLGH